MPFRSLFLIFIVGLLAGWILVNVGVPPGSSGISKSSPCVSSLRHLCEYELAGVAFPYEPLTFRYTVYIERDRKSHRLYDCYRDLLLGGGLGPYTCSPIATR